jgi:MSHA pilin protein MshC
MPYRFPDADRSERDSRAVTTAPATQRGFTLTELVMTITIIGILAVIVAPRFMSSRPFESRGFYDEAHAIVRYAQKTAVARRGTVTVCIAANEIKAVAGANCAAATLPHPSVPSRFLVATAPNGVTVAPVGSIGFDGLGRPNVALPGYTITLTSSVAGDPARQIVVAAETGYVSR